MRFHLARHDDQETIQICTIIDEHTREHVAFTVDQNFDTDSMVKLLDPAPIEHDERPKVIWMDNGPESTSPRPKTWASEDKTIHAFIPARPAVA